MTCKAHILFSLAVYLQNFWGNSRKGPQGTWITSSDWYPGWGSLSCRQHIWEAWGRCCPLHAGFQEGCESPGEPLQHCGPCPHPAAEELIVPSGGGKCGFRWRDWEVFYHVPVWQVLWVVFCGLDVLRCKCSPVVPAVLCVIEGQPPQSLSCTHHQARERKLVATVLQHMGTHTLSFPVSHLQWNPGIRSSWTVDSHCGQIFCCVRRWCHGWKSQQWAVTARVTRDLTKLLQSSLRLLSTQTGLMNWNWVGNTQSWKPSEFVFRGLLWNVN